MLSGGFLVLQLPRLALLSFAVAACVFLAGVSDVRGQKTADKLTDKAKKAKEALKSLVTVEFEDVPLKEAVAELKDQVKGVFIQLDTKGGVSQNGKLSYKGKDVTLEDALDGMFKKNGLGYVIISNKKDAYDGAILVKPSKDRGTILTNR
jgi:hypothetical protein